MNKLDDMRYELIDMARAEALRLWRIARRAEKHGVSKSTVRAIRDEGTTMWDTMTAYPDRLMTWDFRYKFKYAFK